MQKLNRNIELYIGSPIECESERIALRQIIETLNSGNLSAVIMANINLSGRQIDIIVTTESMVLVVEIKGQTRPIRGSENGRWEYKVATGEWKTTGRNYYQQTLDAKNALRDSMSTYLGTSPNYPDAALIFVPSIPEGSEVPSGDFKVRIGDIRLLKNFDTYNKNSNCSLSQQRAFAEHHKLIKVGTLESAIDKQLVDDELILERYKKSFLETYSPQILGLVPFPCRVGEDAVISGEIANQGMAGKNMLIVGPSGCGKSMLAQEIGLRCIEGGIFPVIIEAKYFEKEFSALLNQEAALLDTPSINAIFVACKKFSKPVLIILDGYNECSQTLRQRLSRCLRATAIRYHTGIVVVSQEIYKELEQLNLEIVSVPEPDMEVKKAIANSAEDKEKSLKIEELLDLIKSGLEANIIGHISKTITSKISRYALFDAYIRERLGDVAQDGIRMLTYIGSFLSENVTFSMSVRDFDRLLEKKSCPSSVPKRLLAANLLKRRGDRISFGHELYLNAFSAEAVMRSCGNDPVKLLSAVSAPKHINYKTLIIGAIDNTNLLDSVLRGIEYPEIIISCVTGECGQYAREWAENNYHSVLQHIAQEAKSVRFILDEKEWVNITTGTESFHNWSAQDQSFVNALPHLLSKGIYLNEIFEIVGLMDERVKKSLESLVEEAQCRNIALNRGQFEARMNDQHSAIAIWKIIACIGIHLYAEIKRDSAAMSKWIQSKLADCEISNGQVFMLLKLCKCIWDGKLLINALPTLIRERWKYASSDLRIDLLDAARYCRNCSGEEKAKLVDVINGIETKNIFISTFIIDALKSLGAMEDVEYGETVKAEIEQVFSDTENPENWALAHSIYNQQFDHPYDIVYWDVLHELPSFKRKEFLSMAVRAKNNFRMFVTCMITDLANFKDRNSGKFIEHWTELPPRDDPMPQDSVGAFVVSHIVLGCLQYPLAPKSYDGSCEDNAILSCGEVYYWSNRDDLDWNERKKRCEKAWHILMRHDLGVSLGAIKECESTVKVGLEGFNRLHSKEAIKFSIINGFPDELSEICRQALLGKVIQRTRRRWVKENEMLDYAISILGICGKAIDLPLLRGMVHHQYYGHTAMRAIRQLEGKLTV